MNMINTLYVSGTTLWIVTLAKIADFNPLEDMTDLTGQILLF